MKRIFQLAAYAFIWTLIVLATVNGWNGSILGAWFEPVVFGIILVTLVRGSVMSLWMAVLAGWLYDAASVWPIGVHVMAMLLAIGTVRLLIRFWLTERSAASFVFLIPIGSLVYALSLGLLLFGSHIFFPSALVPAWPIYIRTALMQAGIHALLGGFMLRIRSPRYARTHLRHEF